MSKKEFDFRDPIIQKVVEKFISRSDVGYSKYKVTLDQDSKSINEWLNNIQEELMDAVNYIEKLKSAVDSKQSKSHVKEIPTKLLFQYVASVIYPGDLDEKNGFRWSDVTNIWGLPSGEYFTIDSFPSSKDNKE